MQTLRVGVHKLPTAQAGLVRALVQLLSKGSSDFRWTFAHEGHYDALIVDSQSPDLRDPLLRKSARALSSLGDPQLTAPAELEVLEWPLRADRLESWLTRVQRALAGGGEAPAVAAAPEAATRYRLKRWPPEALLHGDTLRVRMATLLSRRPLTLAELVQVSGQPPERCQTFVQLLQGFNLLLVQQAAPAAPAARPAQQLAATPSRSLIGSIRRRLGL